MARKQVQSGRSRPNRKTTLLIVGEGPDDQAFIKHMNQELRADNSHIRPKIEKQSGGSPGNIITNAVRKYEHQSFDQRYLVLDSDIPISQQDHDKAKEHGYRIIQWSPVCLEGALLDVLGEKVSSNEPAASLKKRLHPLLDGHHTDSAAYQSRFPRVVLEVATNESVVAVKRALFQEPA